MIVIIKNTVEIIEPFQNETFFSWILRMSEWYGYTNFNEKDYYNNFMVNLFGENTKKRVGLYVPSNIDCVIKSINLPNSNYFKSADTLINHMTVYKFYKVFMTNQERDRLSDLFVENNEVINAERKLGVRSNSAYYENISRVKFCSECIKDKKMFYYDVEHQVQGNYICYKHGIRLQYFLHDFRGSTSYSYLNSVWSNAEFCIEPDEMIIDKYKIIALLVHRIMLGEFSDSVAKMKSKFRKKLIDLGYMNELYYIANIDEFFEEFKQYNLFNVTSKSLYYILFNTRTKVNSIIYLSIIVFLFGTLDEYNNYCITDEEIKDMKRKYSSYESLIKNPYTDIESFKHHADIIQKRFGGKFTVLECKLKDKFIVIKHNPCGHVWKLNKNQVRTFKKCAICYQQNRSTAQERKLFLEGMYPEYELVGEKGKYKQVLQIRHNKCGRVITTTFRYIRCGYSCYICRNKDM